MARRRRFKRDAKGRFAPSAASARSVVKRAASVRVSGRTVRRAAVTAVAGVAAYKTNKHLKIHRWH